MEAPPAFPEKSRDESSRFKARSSVHISVTVAKGARSEGKRSLGYIKAIDFPLRVVYVRAEGLHRMLKPTAG
jgi:hypothetical protein